MAAGDTLTLALSEHLGSTLSGAFGHAFRKVFGQWTHVGNGATFGLGGYRLVPARGRVA